MLRKDDPAFKKVVDSAMSQTLQVAAQINAIYEKWFQKPIPPKSINLNVPMSAAVQEGDREPDRLGRSEGLQVSVEHAQNGELRLPVSFRGRARDELQLELEASVSRPSPAARAPTSIT